jgi:hypothetical protein
MQHPLQHEDQCRQIPSTDPTVHQRRQRFGIRSGIEAPYERGGTRSHHRQQRLDRLKHARDPAERQSRRAEADDLPIFRRGVAPDDVYGIGGGGDVIE